MRGLHAVSEQHLELRGRGLDHLRRERVGTQRAGALVDRDGRAAQVRRGPLALVLALGEMELQDGAALRRELGSTCDHALGASEGGVRADGAAHEPAARREVVNGLGVLAQARRAVGLVHALGALKRDDRAHAGGLDGLALRDEGVALGERPLEAVAERRDAAVDHLRHRRAARDEDLLLADAVLDGGPPVRAQERVEVDDLTHLRDAVAEQAVLVLVGVHEAGVDDGAAAVDDRAARGDLLPRHHVRHARSVDEDGRALAHVVGRDDDPSCLDRDHARLFLSSVSPASRAATASASSAGATRDL